MLFGFDPVDHLGGDQIVLLSSIMQLDMDTVGQPAQARGLKKNQLRHGGRHVDTRTARLLRVLFRVLRSKESI
jgi:hypothetical protein